MCSCKIKVKVRKRESWDPGNKDRRREKDERNEQDNVEFGYHDENGLGGLENSQFRFQQEYSTGVQER